MPTNVTTALVGVEVVFLDALLVPLDKTLSKVFLPGENLVLTPLILDASIDHAGNSWLDLLDDAAAQSFRYNAPAFRRA